MKNRRKKPQRLERDGQSAATIFRIAAVDRSGVDREQRSLPIVLATESPVRMYDTERGGIVDEVIVLRGTQHPAQVPILNSHNRQDVTKTYGSIRDLRIEGEQLVGRAYFANDQTSRDLFEKYADGHLTDFSVGAIARKWEYQGNTKRIVESEVIEGSAVVRGADRNARALLAQRAYSEPDQVRDEMLNQELTRVLKERGLKEGATDKELLAFVEEQIQRKDNPLEVKAALDIWRAVNSGPAPASPTQSLPDSKEVLRIERERVARIEDLCTQHGVAPTLKRKWIDEGTSPDAVASEILRSKQQLPKEITNPGGRVEITADARDKFYAAASAAMLARTIADAGVNPGMALKQAEQGRDLQAIERAKELKAEYEQATVVAREFGLTGPMNLARRFCEAANVDVSRMAPAQIARTAIGLPFIARDSAYHVTGSFPQLMLNAMNKTLRAAYDEHPATWSRWVRRAASAPDFKTLNRIRFGEMPDPQVVAENAPYNEVTTGDSKESYGVQKYGEIFSITLEAIVNDDMNAMTRIPAMQGNAMARKVNKVCYAILTANEALSDGIALFHASSHGENLDTNALAESALDTGWAVMKKQTGQTSEVLLNLMPRYLICGPGIAATAYRLTGGGVIPEAVGNVPLYGRGGPRGLEVVEDANISSATAWYLAADNAVIDTVELTFLQGEEAPVLERENGFETDTVKYKIRQTFAAKAIDYRGLYQGNT